MDVNKDVDRVLRAIRAAGGHPLLVGGCVRDHLIGIDSKDIDIEVYGLDPDVLLETLNRVGGVKEAGKSFGVFKMRSGETDIDVSLPRTESKTGAGHRGFTVIPDSSLGMRAASARRDFTINALMFDPQTGEFVDYHHGMEDLEDGVLCHTSDAFADDPLRVLRAVQFVARFGFRVHPETVSMCWDLVDTFHALSIERIWGEFEKIGTRGTHISKALDALDDMGWMGTWFPELVLVSGGSADLAAYSADLRGITGEDRLVIVFAAMLDGLSEALSRSFLGRIGCPEHLVQRIIPLVVNIAAFFEEPTPTGVRVLARKLWPSSINDLNVIYASEAWTALAEEEGVRNAPAPPMLTGDHLIDAGMKPGPSFKTILRAALDAQDAGEFCTVYGAVNWMEEHAGQADSAV